MSLKEWLMAYLPQWLVPRNPWGPRGRPEMPEMHAARNRQQAASLRLDRLTQRAEREAEERRRYTDWQQHSGG